MALDPGGPLTSVSPTSSGRSSPAPRFAKRTVEEGIYKADKVLRRYGAAIERALASWETSPQEWADYIAFLGRLLKAIQAHPPNAPLLPHSDDVAYKLAQCLNPSLPSGVHQKALEVYDYIFSTFGSTYVSDHLHEFLPGLSAVLSFASLSVRPSIYSLYESYLLHLSALQLRPVLKSLILNLLPGLEDEASEDFERAFEILDSMEQIFSASNADGESQSEKDGYFWQCLFLAVISNPSRRQGALNFLSRRLPEFRAKSIELDQDKQRIVDDAFLALSKEAERVISPEPGLLIRCFICGLSDTQLLIQRGFLDLLVANTPLNSPLLQNRVGKEDLDRLVSAAMHVLLRREMSLNKRLWSWFLGSQSSPDTMDDQQRSDSVDKEQLSGSHEVSPFNYFALFGKASLERCVLALFKRNVRNVSEKARPFRICFSLMDRWEIGGSIVPQIFLPAMESVYRYSLDATPEDTAELVRSASLFFDGVEASLIWSDFANLLRASLLEGQSDDDLQMFTWIIQTFNVKDEEMLLIHIPLAASYLLVLLQDTPPEEVNASLQLAALDIVVTLLELVPERAFGSTSKKSAKWSVSTLDTSVIRMHLEEFYRTAGEDQSVPFHGPLLLDLLFQLAASLLLYAAHEGAEVLFSRAASILLSLKSKSSIPKTSSKASRSNAVFEAVQVLESKEQILAFPTLASTLSLLSAFGTSQLQQQMISKFDVAELKHSLIMQVWRYLSPSLPKYHVEAVKSIWQLDDVLVSDESLQSSLTAFMRGDEKDFATRSFDIAEAVQRFAVLWGHSIVSPPSSTTALPRRASGMSSALDSKQSQYRQNVLIEPLMITLDILADDNEDLINVVHGWLHNLPTLRNVFSIHFDMMTESAKHAVQPHDMQSSNRRWADNIRCVQYVLGHLQSILRCANEWTWQCLNDLTISTRTGGSTSALTLLADRCCQYLCDDSYLNPDLEQKVVNVLSTLLQSPFSSSLKSLELDSRLMHRLIQLLSGDRSAGQVSILKLLTSALTLRATDESANLPVDARPVSSAGVKKSSPMLPQTSPTASSTSLSTTPPAQLLSCLQLGFSSYCARPHLDEWLTFLTKILPVFADTISTTLIPLVESLCAELYKLHIELQSLSKTDTEGTSSSPEPAIALLLDALELILNKAHDGLVEDSGVELTPKLSVQSRGLLGNVTTGIFKSDSSASRVAQTNGRLTVILAFQDAVRMSFKLWTWAIRYQAEKTFDKSCAMTASYNALRVRNRTRHLLEHFFRVEPLESLEVMISLWCNASDSVQATAALDLLHIMHGLRPKVVLAITLDALYSRTSPSTLSTARQSCQATELTTVDITLFLSAYLQTTEDDAMDEIWTDYMAFLRDVLSNPLPYRQVLPALLSIILLLAQKTENTNFGEQRKLRRDLGDVFMRLLSASFTVIPSGVPDANGLETTANHKSISLVAVLTQGIENIEVILENSDRVTSVINSVTTSLISPVFHAKTFPSNVTPDTLALLLQMSKKGPSAKSWKKELSDAFNDPRILLCPSRQMLADWFPILRQWCLHDKERVPDILSRLTAPSSAGIMFGVGASAARLDTDRKTQLNLRRLCLLLLASTKDTFVTQLRAIEEKLVELFEASTSSSPSSAVKSELFMVCRALVLSISAVHLGPLWPLFNNTMQSALMSLMPSALETGTVSNLSLLQGCKLLDLLIADSPDEFQLHEWLYVSDTIDAVYQPANWAPTALSDQIAESLRADERDELASPVTPTAISSGTTGRRRPLLDNSGLPNHDDIKAMTRDDFARLVLRPFFSELSLHAYEGFYSMEVPDLSVCRRNLLDDVLDMSTIVE